jgi:hypothetical protein
MSAPLPLLPLPDFETMVLDRLYLCCQEITGLNKVFRLPPANALNAESFPICYPLVGAVTEPFPISSDGAGRFKVARSYVLRVLGSPATNTVDNSATAGTQALIDLVPFFNRFRSYFMGHPSLETTTLGALQYMSDQLLYSDLGIVNRPAPGDIQHFAIEITLVITMQAQVKTLA